MESSQRGGDGLHEGMSTTANACISAASSLQIALLVLRWSSPFFDSTYKVLPEKIDMFDVSFNAPTVLRRIYSEYTRKVPRQVVVHYSPPKSTSYSTPQPGPYASDNRDTAQERCGRFSTANIWAHANR
jgi:hypothetical protein